MKKSRAVETASRHSQTRQEARGGGDGVSGGVGAAAGSGLGTMESGGVEAAIRASRSDPSAAADAFADRVGEG